MLNIQMLPAPRFLFLRVVAILLIQPGTLSFPTKKYLMCWINASFSSSNYLVCRIIASVNDGIKHRYSPQIIVIGSRLFLLLKQKETKLGGEERETRMYHFLAQPHTASFSRAFLTNAIVSHSDLLFKRYRAIQCPKWISLANFSRSANMNFPINHFGT